MKEKEKNCFLDLKASSKKSQFCDSRQACSVAVLEGGALNGGLQARIALEFSHNQSGLCYDPESLIQGTKVAALKEPL